MKSETALISAPRSRWQRIAAIVISIFFLAVAIGLIVLAKYWPFSEKEIIETLQEVVPDTKVTIAHFHSTYFLHPGCWAEGVTFIRLKSPSAPALVTVQKLTIQANYPELFVRPGYISRIIIDGLHIQVPPQGSSVASSDASRPANAFSKRTVVGEIVSNNALLEIGRRDDAPLKFEIRKLHLGSVGIAKSMSYTVDLRNPLPPGDIQATGYLGPWNSDIGQIPLSGSYTFDRANLGAFDGIDGTLSSTGRFQGRLGQIDVAGDTKMPNFAVRDKGHPVTLDSHFRAEVDGTNGDVKINAANVQLQNTAIQVHGAIVGKPPADGKITTLDLVSSRGRVQDVLRPFVKSPSAPMSGPISLHAHVVFSSERHPFFKNVNLTGDFVIDHGRFNSADTQHNVDELSRHSRGIKDSQSDPPSAVESHLASRVSLSNGVAQFSNLVMDLPGASAQLHGTFSVLNEKVDFHGTLKTDVELSKTTHGLKAALLKPLDPLFKRKRGGASIPVEMTGTYSRPHFGMEILQKH